MPVTTLASLGWDDFFDGQVNSQDAPDLAPARIADEQRGHYQLLNENGRWIATLAGRLLHEMEESTNQRPTVGDWVLARLPTDPAGGVAVIHRCLTRRTAFTRQAPGRTIALVGSSGVGKSTILNHLAGEEVARVQDIRDDDRGRHTTTSRQLVVLPGGAILLDTPGMRTVLLWEGADGLEQTFDDLATLARECRFRDCAHEAEPGCAVRAAIEAGTLDASRFQSYRKLEREVRHQEARTDTHARLAERDRWKRIHRQLRARPDKRRI